MIQIPEVGKLEKAIATGVIHSGITIRLADGEPATLAIIDSNGQIVESGKHVIDEIWNVALTCYQCHLLGKGFFRVHTKPPGIGIV